MNRNLLDRITISLCFVALAGLAGWMVSEARGFYYFPDDPRPREEVILKFKPGEFVPAGGITERGRLVALRVDSRGYAICSPTVYLSIEKEKE